MSDNLDRIFSEIRKLAEGCPEFSVFFKGYAYNGQIMPTYTLSFTRELLNAKPQTVKESFSDNGRRHGSASS